MLVECCHIQSRDIAQAHYSTTGAKETWIHSHLLRLYVCVLFWACLCVWERELEVMCVGWCISSSVLLLYIFLQTSVWSEIQGYILDYKSGSCTQQRAKTVIRHFFGLFGTTYAHFLTTDIMQSLSNFSALFFVSWCIHLMSYRLLSVVRLRFMFFFSEHQSPIGYNLQQVSALKGWNNCIALGTSNCFILWWCMNKKTSTNECRLRHTNGANQVWSNSSQPRITGT